MCVRLSFFKTCSPFSISHDCLLQFTVHLPIHLIHKAEAYMDSSAYVRWLKIPPTDLVRI